MAKFTDLTPDEIERRRMASVAVMNRMDRDEFDQWYQEKCDTEYWTKGQCCAGCDYWQSDMGNTGECTSNGLVSGDDVLASIGIVGWSGPKKPGFPYTHAEFWCGKFKDEFDWSTLDSGYLAKIGAAVGGKLLPKPPRRRKPD